MAVKWYCMINEEERGPLDSSQLVDLAKSGMIAPSDWLRPDGDEVWVPAARVKGLFPEKSTSSDTPKSIEDPPAPEPHSPSEIKVSQSGRTQVRYSRTGKRIIMKTGSTRGDAPATSKKSARGRSKSHRDDTAWKIVGVLTAVGVVAVLITWLVNRPKGEEASNESDQRQAEPSAVSSPLGAGTGNAPSPVRPVLSASAPEEKITFEGLTISVSGVESSRPYIVSNDGIRLRPRENAIVIDLLLMLDRDASAPVRYMGWGRSILENRGVELTDERGIRYQRPRAWPGDIEQQATEEQQILPMQSITDRLVFENDSGIIPDRLTLRLPTSALIHVAARNENSESTSLEEESSDAGEEVAENDPDLHPEYLEFEIPGVIIETPVESGGLRVINPDNFN
jgi:hypothetical protein